jgi:hypothetical protein
LKIEEWKLKYNSRASHIDIKGNIKRQERALGVITNKTASVVYTIYINTTHHSNKAILIKWLLWKNSNNTNFMICWKQTGITTVISLR